MPIKRIRKRQSSSQKSDVPFQSQEPQVTLLELPMEDEEKKDRVTIRSVRKYDEPRIQKVEIPKSQSIFQTASVMTPRHAFYSGLFLGIVMVNLVIALIFSLELVKNYDYQVARAAYEINQGK